MEFRWKVKERARNYIDRMPDSVQGQGGSHALFNVAAVLMRGFSLDEADGMELLAEWNERHAHPRWSQVELRHKLRDGAKADRPDGYMLRRERERVSQSCSSKDAHHHTPSHQTSAGIKPKALDCVQPAAAFPSAACCASHCGEAAHDALVLPSHQRVSPSLQQAVDSSKRQQAARSPGPSAELSSHCSATRYSPPAPSRTRSTTAHRTPIWPSFSPLTDEDRDRIAILRQVPCAAVEVVRRAGLLGKAHYEGHECFIMGEGRFAQARRFDGGLLPVQGGRQQSKAKNLPGSEGAFLGRKWALGSTCPVLLVEGVIGLVEALGALMMARDALDWTCLAAVSASSRFARDPYLLHALKGRRVHIIPDAGSTGWEAAGAWMGELEDAGAHPQLEPVPLPIGCRDLGDVVSRVYQHASPDDDIHFQGCLHRAPDDLREYLQAIFE